MIHLFTSTEGLPHYIIIRKHPFLSQWGVEGSVDLHARRDMTLIMHNSTIYTVYHLDDHEMEELYYTSITESINSHDCSKLKQYNIMSL